MGFSQRRGNIDCPKVAASNLENWHFLRKAGRIKYDTPPLLVPFPLL
jgi:hypothetical protein